MRPASQQTQLTLPPSQLEQSQEISHPVWVSLRLGKSRPIGSAYPQNTQFQSPHTHHPRVHRDPTGHAQLQRPYYNQCQTATRYLTQGTRCLLYRESVDLWEVVSTIKSGCKQRSSKSGSYRGGFHAPSCSHCIGCFVNPGSIAERDNHQSALTHHTHRSRGYLELCISSAWRNLHHYQNEFTSQLKNICYSHSICTCPMWSKTELF